MLFDRNEDLSYDHGLDVKTASQFCNGKGAFIQAFHE